MEGWTPALQGFKEDLEDPNQRSVCIRNQRSAGGFTMSWAPLLLVLVSYCTCSSSQFVVTQEPSVSVSPGGTAKLSCSRSGGSVTGDTYPSWYQQTLGNAPKLLVYSSSTSNNNVRPSGIPTRFTGSISGNTAYLTIDGLQADDDAEYHCALYAGSGTWIFGGGTQLNVLSGETKAPALNIFPPSSEEVATSKATLVCTMEDFYPGSVTVTWKADGAAINSGVETTRPSKQSGNNLFMASSFLTVPAVDWSGGKKYTCQATHDSKIIEKSVKHSECV